MTCRQIFLGDLGRSFAGRLILLVCAAREAKENKNERTRFYFVEEATAEMGESS
jgi:hypothetical protein